jgi:NYN domain
MSRHVFIDNSNVIWGAQRASATLEPGAVWLAVRVYWRNLFALVEHPGKVVTRVLSGSIPPGNEQLWEYAQREGYDTKLLHKVERDDGRLGEQAVDEMLILQMSHVLLDFDPPQTMVLVTGDGNETEFGNSFSREVERAMKRGWEVEVWSWKDQLSQRFGRIRSPTGRQPKICHFDPHWKQITFTQAGQYVVNGVAINVAGRVVSPLRRGDG